MQLVFWISVAFLFYRFVLYPPVLWLWAQVSPRRPERRYGNRPLSVVVAVCDAEKHIEAHLKNLLGQEYPEDLVEVIVVSYGCTDRTTDIAKSVGDPRVRVLECAEPDRAQALNLGVRSASHPIVLFTDPTHRLRENAFAELGAFFHDRTVGAVSGEAFARRERAGEDWYADQERRLRRLESGVDSVVGATAAIYAVRKGLFVELPPRLLAAEFLVPMRVVLMGFRAISVPSVKALDWGAAGGRRDLSREIRRVAGSLQGLWLEPRLLLPLRNRAWFQTLSHTLAVAATPYFLASLFLSNLFLAGPFFRCTLGLQLLFYLAVLLRFTRVAEGQFGRIVRFVWTIAVVNVAALVGPWIALNGRNPRAGSKGDLAGLSPPRQSS